MKPEYVKVGNKKYKINTDFRVGLECNRIAEDETISDYERAKAIIYKLFGNDGYNDKFNHEVLIELSIKYLSRGDENKTSNREPNMDFEQDRGRINSSFFSVYGLRDIWGIDYMHLYDFYDYLNGLTEDCALNYARYVRDFDMSSITDSKELKLWKERKEEVALKKKTTKLKDEEINKINKFMDRAKIK